LDDVTSGLQGGITVIAGSTQTGKTSLSVQFLLAALQHDPELVVIHYLLDDMTCDDLDDMLVCHVAKVDYKKYESASLSREEQKRIEVALKWLHDEIQPRKRTLALGNHDPTGYGLTKEKMVDHITRFRRYSRAKRAMVIIDMFDDMAIPELEYDPNMDISKEFIHYIRRIEADPGRWRLQQILGLSTWSQDAIQGGVPILVLAKLRKPLHKNDEPRIADLLGSVDLGYKAKRIFFLVPETPLTANSAVVPVSLCVKKGRFAQCIRLPLSFHHTQFRFEEAHAPLSKDADNNGSKAKTKRNGSAKTKGQPSAIIDPFAGMQP